MTSPSLNSWICWLCNSQRPWSFILNWSYLCVIFLPENFKCLKDLCLSLPSAHSTTEPNAGSCSLNALFKTLYIEGKLSWTLKAKQNCPRLGKEDWVSHNSSLLLLGGMLRTPHDVPQTNLISLGCHQNFIRQIQKHWEKCSNNKPFWNIWDPWKLPIFYNVLRRKNAFFPTALLGTYYRYHYHQLTHEETEAQKVACCHTVITEGRIWTSYNHPIFSSSSSTSKVLYLLHLIYFHTHTHIYA